MRPRIPFAIATIAVGLALTVPASAAAATNTLTGTVGGDLTSSISMQVKVKKGKAKKVKSFAWQGLDGHCDGVLTTELSGSASQLETKAFPSPFRVFGPYDQAAGPGDVVDISGTVVKKGKKVVNGLISVAFNGGLCTGPPLGLRSFTATK